MPYSINIGSGYVLLPDSTKPLPEPVVTNCQLNAQAQSWVKFISKYNNFHSRKCIWKYLQIAGHFIQT